MVLENTTAAAFIGASVTLVLVIIFMILMVILVRQCLAFMAKRNALRAQVEEQMRVRQEMERRRRLSVTEPVRPTYDWHHSIRVEGTPPPSYREAKKLPSIEKDMEVRPDPEDKKEKVNEIHTGEDSVNDLQITIEHENTSIINTSAVGAENNQTEENGNDDVNIDNRLHSSTVQRDSVVVAMDDGGVEERRRTIEQETRN